MGFAQVLRRALLFSSLGFAFDWVCSHRLAQLSGLARAVNRGLRGGLLGKRP
jgi:hypothetical protein